MIVSANGVWKAAILFYVHHFITNMATRVINLNQFRPHILDDHQLLVICL